MRHAIPTLAIVGVLCAPMTNVAVSQAVARGHRQDVTVALVDTLPKLREAFFAVIIRGPGQTGRDVILLPRATASGALLDQATRVLLDSRIRLGDHPVQVHGKPFKRLILGVRGGNAHREWTDADIAKAQVLVDKLLSAPPREVPLVGRVPAIRFLPPPIRVAADHDLRK